MSEHQPPPDRAAPEDENLWQEMASGKPESLREEPQDVRPKRALRLLPAFAVLLFVFAGVWLAWPWFHSNRSVPDGDRPGSETRAVSTADQSCEKVTRLIRELPSTQEEIKTVTSQIQDETKRIEGLVADVERGKREWARLGLVYGDLKRARVGLAAKVKPFITREVVTRAEDPKSGSLSIKDAKGFEIAYGPGKDLLDAVERYDATCRKLLDQHGVKGGESGATWGK